MPTVRPVAPVSAKLRHLGNQHLRCSGDERAERSDVDVAVCADVPTGLHVGADGNVYVATLGAFIPGAAQVLIAQADGSFVEAELPA